MSTLETTLKGVPLAPASSLEALPLKPGMAESGSRGDLIMERAMFAAQVRGGVSSLTGNAPVQISNADLDKAYNF